MPANASWNVHGRGITYQAAILRVQSETTNGKKHRKIQPRLSKQNISRPVGPYGQADTSQLSMEYRSSQLA